MTKRTPEEKVAPPPTPKRSRKLVSWEDFACHTPGTRVLSCGTGDQIGHPGRTTTKKPRKIDIVEEEGMKIVQIAAGGVHSALLTAEGTVYTCGINEKGTVPAEGVEPEGSTDEFTKINFSDEVRQQGRIVMLTAGASFTAALTSRGSVIAWGNLRDGSGKMDVHQQLIAMQKQPIIVLRHKPGFSIAKIAAGENHLVMLSEDGRVFTFGDFSMGQLGRSARLDRIRTQYIAADSESSLLVSIVDGRKKVRCKNIFAGGYWSAFLSEEHKLFVCGLNNYGQLGFPVEDEGELRIFIPRITEELSGKNWTHIEGVQHLVLRSVNGEVFAIGKNTDNALGLGNWSNSESGKNWKYNTLQKLNVDNCAGVAAQLGCSIAWNYEGDAFSWGFDSSGQLGLGLKDDEDKTVPRPEKISSAHLDGFKIMHVSLADNHALFFAAKI